MGDQIAPGKIPVRVLNVLTYSEMIKLPKPEWLVEGVIQEGSTGLIFGNSDAGKSFIGIDIGCSVAVGKSWHGQAVASRPQIRWERGTNSIITERDRWLGIYSLDRSWPGTVKKNTS